jgi:hypothetical protein
LEALSLAAFFVDVHGIMPLDVKRQLFDDFLVGQIMKLLQGQRTKDSSKLLRRMALIAGKGQGKFINR